MRSKTAIDRVNPPGLTDEKLPSLVLTVGSFGDRYGYWTVVYTYF